MPTQDLRPQGRRQRSGVVSYPQALAIWHHRLNERRLANIARMERVAAASGLR